MTDMCTSQHCGGVSDYINQTCKKEGWPLNHLVLVCDPTTGVCCNCTCSCLAYNTPVAVGNDVTAAIQAIAAGDPVLARENDQWVEKKVAFSNGTDANSVQPEMCYLSYEDEDKVLRIIVVTLDHTFLNNQGKLIRARQLKKGDMISLASGNLTKIQDYAVKSYVGGVWNIATSTETPTSLEGHLINTQGLISGDYTVQLFYPELAEKGLAVPATEAPEFNTQQYQDQLNDSNAQPAFMAATPSIDINHYMTAVTNPANGGKTASTNGGVYFHLDHTHVLNVPKAMQLQGYLTSAQAQQVKAKDSVVDRNIVTKTEWLLTIIRGFYPAVNFVVDYPNRHANAFALYLDGQPTVLLQGGLLRAKQLDWQATALITAYCIARMTGEQNKGDDGYVCKPQADYNVIGILTNVFYPLYPEVIFPALTQISDLFDAITDKQDDPVSGCHPSALDCRISTYEKAMQYLPLPTCAGGSTEFLKVEGASSTSTTEAVVTFDAPLNPTEAIEVENYALEPATTIIQIDLIAPDNNQVRLTADYQPDTKYTVTVSNVRSVTGLTLSSTNNSATFTSVAG